MAMRRAAALDDLWSGDMMACRVGGADVVLVRFGDAVCAYEDRCAHLGVPLSEGTLEGDVLTCRAHQWQYDARSGEGVNPRASRLRRYPVAVRDGTILVDVE